MAEKTERLEIRLTPEQRAKVDAAAAEKGLSIGEVIRKLVDRLEAKP